MIRGRPRGRQRRGTKAKRLPPVGVLVITGVDSDGYAQARPDRWPEEVPPPVIRLEPERRAGRAIGAGERVLARLSETEPGHYLATAIRRLSAERPRTVLGIYELVDGKGRLRPTNRRVKTEFHIARRDALDARPGELVRAEAQPSPRRSGMGAGMPEARVLERLGGGEPWQTASLIAIEEHQIPDRFPQAAIDEAEAAGPAPADGREDLRAIPLMTIDDETARDFDDAVWAEPDPDPANPGGFHLIVAIADVAWYVRAGSALDEEARERGNSVYFPDRVVPMLPEALSNGWCSIKPGEDRPCMAVHIRIDAQGNTRSHRFTRALMRSAARQTYRGVQSAIEGDRSVPLHGEIEALSGAFGALSQARAKRGTLELEIPERRIVLGEDGRVAGIERRRTLAAHRLIEEFMIAANVAAAETLEAKAAPCVYRVHDSPDEAKVEALRGLLETLGLKLPRGERMRPRHFTRLLDQAASSGAAEMLHEAILRTQAQAAYGLDNLGHFGLALARYAHFTSPIRRYGDLLVHRALIAALGLGDDGVGRGEKAALEQAARHISITERRAAAAERDAVDRLCAAYLSDRIGATFAARITGITRAGLFVRLADSGADALIPLSMLALHPVRIDPNGFRLSDRRGRTVFRLGDAIEVRLLDVDTTTGSLLCGTAEAGGARAQPNRTTKPVSRRRRSMKS